MSDALALLWTPFLVALALVGIHGYFGLQVLARKIIFVDLALAQIAALGTTVAYMLGHPPQSPAAYGYSLLFTFFAALLLSFTRGWAGRIPQEALIGVIYVVPAAAAILLIDQAPQGAEHLRQILTGNILLTTRSDLAGLVPLYAAVGLLQWYVRPRLDAAGKGWISEFVFFASFGVIVTSSVAVAGVLLVFSFLIIPAAIGVLFSNSESRQLAIGWIVGAVASAAGLATSYAFDLPTGATMVCVFGVALASAGAARFCLGRNSGDKFARVLGIARWASLVVLALSSAWLMAVPRADQPLLDLVETAFPTLRKAYMRQSEASAYSDAGAYAERYRREGLRLNEMEVRSRSGGMPLDDMQVQRISSMLKTYNEMRKGEEFVRNEVRSRARERVRWAVGGFGLLTALLLVPGALGRGRRSLESIGQGALPLFRLPMRSSPERGEEIKSSARTTVRD